MGAILCAPIRSMLLSRAGNGSFRAGAAMMQGFREAMEDSHCICLALPGHPDVAFFGVYDGHSGDKVSKHLAKHLHHRIAKLGPDFEDEAIKEAVVQLDLEVGQSDFKNHGSTCVFVIVRPMKEATPSGATKPQSWRVTAVNVGDSRAMIVRSGGALVSLTEDHKPSNPLEAARIQKAGGFVNNDRTDGELAMSRAIGDFKYKTNTRLSSIEQKVIALPEIKHEVIHTGDNLLVICDGVVERINNKQVARYTYSRLDAHKADPAIICRELILHSLASGSTDNHSAILVGFEDGEGYTAPDTFIPGPMKPWKDDQKFVAAYIKNAEAWGQDRESLPKLTAEADARMPFDWKNLSPSRWNMEMSAPTQFLISIAVIILAYHFAFNTDWGLDASQLGFLGEPDDS